MALLGETCNHVAASMYRIETAVRIGLTDPASTSNANEWLLNQKTIGSKKIKHLYFSREDFGQKWKKETISSPIKEEIWSPEKLWLKTHWVWKILLKLSS